MTPKNAPEAVSKMAIKEVKYGGKKYSVSYEIVNPAGKDVALFLHGWGANKEIMKKAFGAYFERFRHVYVDMPGFGASDMHGALSTKDYAKIMKSFLDELGVRPKIILGHSFGGKVATLLKPENIVLLSSAGIVAKKPLWVRFKIALFKFLKLFGLGFLYKFFATKDVKGMSKTMYETLKNVVDEDFSSKFTDFGGRAFIFWGEEDKATPLKSGERIARLIKKSEFHPLKGDHFFFLLHACYIDGVVTAGLNSADTDDDSGVESVRVLRPKSGENEDISGQNDERENVGERNLTAITSVSSRQDAAVRSDAKASTQNSLFDEPVSNENSSANDGKPGGEADKFSKTPQGARSNFGTDAADDNAEKNENLIAKSQESANSEQIWAQTSLFDEQTKSDDQISGANLAKRGGQNRQILSNEILSAEEQDQISLEARNLIGEKELEMSAQIYRESAKKPVQQTFDLG